MPQTASSIITRANQIARTINYTSQALQELNSLLGHISRTIDFSAARGQFNFFFATALVSSGAGNIITASPNPLPIDYLRVPVSTGSTGAQRSSKWYIQGVPYDMVEIDLTEWDDQVQQAGIQSYPYFWAKDMAQLQITAQPTGDLDTTSQIVNNVSSLTGVAVGMSIAGGIGPQSIIVPGTTITVVTPGTPNTITLSQAPAPPTGQAAIQMAGASLIIGYPPMGYPYPPPSGAFPVMLRYQRIMPPLTQAQVNAGAYCWFDDDQALVDGLAGRMMAYSDDARDNPSEARFRQKMAQYLALADDNANRAQTVQLDRRTFGRSFSSLKNTKTVGW